jgi:hypothetical protein
MLLFQTSSKKGKRNVRCWLVYAYNPSYSGARDQEDHSSKPDLGKCFTRPYLEKNSSQKRAGGLAQGVGPEFTPQYCKKNQIKPNTFITLK